MAVTGFVSRLRREPFAHCPVARYLEQACRDAGLKWRERLLPPLVTLRLFVLQVLHGNTSIAHLRQLSGIDFAPASYCEARMRLPLTVLTSLLSSLVSSAGAADADAESRPGQRLLIVDCSNFSMSDGPELHEHFHLPQGTRPGIGYPLATVMGLIDAATGLFVQMLCLPLFVHDMSAVTHVHDALRGGDILLGDRAFCSFAHVALLNARGVFACFRLHQRRQGGGGRGRRRWRRPKQTPKWIAPRQYRSLPQWIDVRLVSYGLSREGFRTRRVTIATTLLDRRQWPDAKVARLYGQRWQIEGCFDHLKTTMNMNVLKCQSVQGVLKELAVYLLVYNLVRLAMLHAARRQRVSAGRISFIDALRLLACRAAGLGGVRRLLTNPHRPRRRDPRVIRRRKKPYDLLTRPRAELKNLMKSRGKC